MNGVKRGFLFIGVLLVVAILLWWWPRDRQNPDEQSHGIWFYGYEILPDGAIVPPDIDGNGFNDPGNVDFSEEEGETRAPKLVGLLDKDGDKQDDGELEDVFLFPPDAFIDDGWGFGPECRVTRARISYNAKTDNPLTFPVAMRSPAPGAGSAADATGSSVGPIPGPVPQTHRVGNNFEYHSDLNGVPGCTSRQFVTSFDATLLPRVNAVARANVRPVRPDSDAAYLGDTATGARRFPATGETFYEGTPNVIHWLDAPALELVPNPRRNFVTVVVQLLKSVTYDGNGSSGMLCLTGHTYIVQDNNGAPMAPAAAQALLQNANPVGGNNAPADLKKVTRLLRMPPAMGGYRGQANPEFRNLGCYRF